MAVDTSYIDWILNGSSTIGRANLDGSSPNQSFIPGGHARTQLTVGATHIYWQGSFSIGRATLDGTIVEEFLIAISPNPADGFGGLAVDASHVYWSQGLPRKVGRADLVGSNVNESFISAAVNVVSRLAVDANYIYWTTVFGAIGRANLDGTSPNNDFITGISFPLGLAVDLD